MYGSGLNNGSTDIAHLHLVALMEYAARNKLSIAILFVDISVAFASLSRRIVLMQWETDEEFINNISQQGVDRNVALDFLTYLHNNPMWQGQSELHVHEMLKQVHTNTWNSFEFL